MQIKHLQSPSFHSPVARGAVQSPFAKKSVDGFAGSVPAPPPSLPKLGSSVETGPSNRLREAFDAIPTAPHTSKLRLLSDNAESWTARWELLESADSEINAQYYAWDNDVFGLAMLGHIYHKATQGVKTRIMVDAVGDTIGKRGFKSHLGGRDYLQELVALPNAEARVYHPNHQKLLTALTHPLGSEGIAANHDKILEVDARAVIAGGRNISHHYYMDPRDKPDAWRDTDLHLEGAGAAQEFRDAFEIEFDKHWITEKVGKDKLGNWKKRSGELLAAYSMMDSWLKAPPLSQAEKEDLRSNPETRAGLVKEIAQQAHGAASALNPQASFNKTSTQRIQELAQELVGHLELRGASHSARSRTFAGEEVKVIDTTSGVGKPLDEMNQTFVDLVDASQSRIDIQSPYFVLTEGAIEALQRAGKRGVEISISTNTPSSTDSGHTQVFFLNDWKKALAAIPNLTIHGATGERKMHGKMAIFDDEISVVSSYNLDLVSKEINGEVGAVIRSREFAREARGAIKADFADPTVGYRQYQIAWDTEGRPVEAEGRLVSVFGPEDHVQPEKLQKYDKKIKRWNWLRKYLPQLQELRRFV